MQFSYIYLAILIFVTALFFAGINGIYLARTLNMDMLKIEKSKEAINARLGIYDDVKLSDLNMGGG